MMNISEFVIRLSCAFIAGFAIGFERQWHHKTAGLRTNTLVAVGSAIYTLISLQLVTQQGEITRVIGQVVTGVGFLGVGIIYKEGVNVHGLTTAATVWCSSAAGCMAATGFYYETIISTLAILAVNALLKPIDSWLSNRSKTDSNKDDVGG